MNILAHRGYFDGPDPNSENRPESMARCLERGWGLETDIRQAGAHVCVVSGYDEVDYFRVRDFIDRVRPEETVTRA